MKNLTEYFSESEKLVSIKTYLTESKGWEMMGNEGGQNFDWSPKAEFMLIQTEGQSIGFMTAEDIKRNCEDFDDEEAAKEILALKPGEMYNADGGINIYIRIK